VAARRTAERRRIAGMDCVPFFNMGRRLLVLGAPAGRKWPRRPAWLRVGKALAPIVGRMRSTSLLIREIPPIFAAKARGKWSRARIVPREYRYAGGELQRHLIRAADSLPQSATLLPQPTTSAQRDEYRRKTIDTERTVR
jgi:hypothetical protein